MKKYDAYSVRVDTGEKTKVNASPMNHDEACTFKSKLNHFDHRRIELIESVERSRHPLKRTETPLKGTNAS